MKPIIRKRVERWIKALRSGKYQQATACLRDSTGFCCLGVACDISKKGKWEFETYIEGKNREQFVLSKRVKNHFGLQDVSGRFSYRNNVKGALAVLNDDKKYSFDQIADFLEQELNNPKTNLFQ